MWPHQADGAHTRRDVSYTSVTSWRLQHVNSMERLKGLLVQETHRQRASSLCGPLPDPGATEGGCCYAGGAACAGWAPMRLALDQLRLAVPERLRQSC